MHVENEEFSESTNYTVGISFLELFLFQNLPIELSPNIIINT